MQKFKIKSGNYAPINMNVNVNFNVNMNYNNFTIINKLNPKILSQNEFKKFGATMQKTNSQLSTGKSDKSKSTLHSITNSATPSKNGKQI